jgi:putative hydrolase of the HAD superfamily
MSKFDVIAFDADDTLWHTEYLYSEAQEKYKQLLAHYLSADEIEKKLYDTEIRNLQHFGYGIKAFTLSLIETAIELTQGQITSGEIQAMLDVGKTMLSAEVRLIDHAADTLAMLTNAHTLMLITKGDLYDQESKIMRSGLAPHFRHIEIVSTKSPQTYQALLTKYQITPSRFLMIGNSPRSDILPVLAIGGHAVYIPYPITWMHEVADLPPTDHIGYFQLENLGQLPELLTRLTTLEVE